MNNFSLSFKTVNEIENFTYPSVVDTPSTLIQIFCANTNIDTIVEIQQYFSKKYPRSVIIGTTTDGIIESLEVHTATKNVATFTIFEKTTLKSALIKHNNSLKNSYQTGKAIASALLKDDTKVIISFADGIETNGEEYVEGIASIAPSITLSGGLAADNGELIKTYVFDKNEVISSGAVGVSLNSKNLSVNTKYTFDWMPVGKKLTVTRAINNRIYEIDGISTVDIYAKYLGRELANKLPQVGIEYPLIFEKNGVFIGRAVLHKHHDGSLTFAGNIPIGTEVSFGIGNIENILKNSGYNANKLLSEMKFKSEATFIYSCMARRRFMNEHMICELKILETIGNISGFFTYGEFFHSKDNNQLLNETMTMLSISENEDEILKQFVEPSILDNYDFTSHSEHVIAHLSNVVSKELAELNENLEQRIKESSDFIYKQAYFDKLTGLPNRLSLINTLEITVNRVIFLFNIDDFAVINDFYGHDVGDLILKKLADVLEKVSKNDNAELFKLPSDEFAIIISMLVSNEEREKKINQYLTLIKNENFLVHNSLIHISVTIATAFLNENKRGYNNADMALKLAKKSSKDYMIFDENLQLAKHYEDNFNTANLIRNAIDANNVVPHFQPMLNLKTLKIDKYESLARIEHDNQILYPHQFIEISEKIKLYPQITKIMIEKVFRYFSDKDFSFSINLAFSDLLDPGTRNFLFSKIEEYAIASKLTIEILETQESEDEFIAIFVDELYSVGANIAIDDFGSGYANFKHVTTMKSDYLKIDGSLIKNLDIDTNARLVVETIIVFARKLNKKIIAEFVHSKEILDIVSKLDVDYAQGYYIGKPQDAVL